MGEEDRNPDLIRRESKELSNIRKVQQRIKLWGGVMLGANLLLLAACLWVLGQGTNQPVPAETDFQYPPPAMPAEENDSAEITDIVTHDAGNTNSYYSNNTNDTDNTDDTCNPYVDVTDNADEMEETDDTNISDNTKNVDNLEESFRQTESPSPSVPVAVSPEPARPVSSRPITTRPAATRSVKTPVRPASKKVEFTIPACIITRVGMTLRSLARRYYGSEVFWIYIYDRNIKVLSSLDISSLDALPSGIRLDLPRPTDYEIDATEPISLQRACNLAKSMKKQ